LTYGGGRYLDAFPARERETTKREIKKGEADRGNHCHTMITSEKTGLTKEKSALAAGTDPGNGEFWIRAERGDFYQGRDKLKKREKEGKSHPV